VAADFLLSPEAQARKQDPRHWGSLTVLDLARLAPEERAFFAAIPPHDALPAPGSLAPALPEPHPSWMEAVERLWLKRYQGG
jgi:putative thiamine transport system substrate-binding protein